MQKRKRYASIDKKECVACGSCIKICPLAAITVPKGIHAEVNRNQCIGCGKCLKSCPASVIEIVDEVMHKEDISYEKQTKKVV
ncbi:4Fe-4S dicluster domain-containing protein [Anaerosacchariphilus polymeriproducens]|uniref:4Fe-4S dicluster domain-containing protein n=1 Tax=Anaerosacchariphilus polymeriproducens TaxID=1812858 RepID=A0A371AVG7_9FIRM|nr:4Fe-4S dicluster-binding protein [Anaerosacchariphilus polymeriproducens]RDU23531.1 4Fe-4S dicluster domain-containing protein [Anaerosacchariphilus polymeriproducens]